MRAATITRPGGPDVLELRDVERPQPGTGEVLVRVRASALNRADLLQREGRYPAPPGWPKDIPGMEIAGEVVQCAPGASLWVDGDRVFGIVGGGANAEFIVTHERTLAAIPSNLSWHEAAAVPEAFITAHDALVTQAAVRASEHVLIHAVGSGVGLAALQLTRAVGAVPIGDARSADKIERARVFGLEHGITVTDDPSLITKRTQELTGGSGAEIVLDLVGGPYTSVSIAAAAPKGRIILIGTMAGREASLPLGTILGKRLTLRGTVLRARPLEEKILATRAFAAQVVPLLARGVIRPVIDKVFPLNEIAAAHRHLASNATFGKVVIAHE
ncbi:MAG TPA: NAD(P)H-quinone oxidoreductase [Gemmatimonadaceae bacterium]|nr:NAD(P)H-quinone oxidoreductase [Gemmatimonadaceae bacterium]